jgi:hypothetical protein
MNDELKDPRWLKYKEDYYSTPIYYFNDLTYPENEDEAKAIIHRLALEIKNIDGQFDERELEIEAFGPANRETAIKEYSSWKIKALRAQRMKNSQIRIIECWMLKNTSYFNKKLEDLEKRVESLESTKS